MSICVGQAFAKSIRACAATGVADASAAVKASAVKAAVKAPKSAGEVPKPKPLKVARKSKSASAPVEEEGDDEFVEEYILSLRVSGPTIEQKPRIEVCARTQTKARLFICSLIVSKHPGWKKLTASMHDLVAGGKATKGLLLVLRDQLLVS